MPSVEFYGQHYERPTYPVGDAEVALVRHAMDQHELRFALDLAVPDQRWIVAGGGLGWTSARLSLSVGVRNVVTFEPNSRLADNIRRYVRVGGCPLTVIDAALSTETGKTTFYRNENWGISTLEPEKARADSQSITVETMSLLDAIASYEANALLLDVEEHEHVMQTALNAANGLHTLVVEVHRHIERFRHRMDEGNWRIVREWHDPAGGLAVLGAVR